MAKKKENDITSHQAIQELKNFGIELIAPDCRPGQCWRAQKTQSELQQWCEKTQIKLVRPGMTEAKKKTIKTKVKTPPKSSLCTISQEYIMAFKCRISCPNPMLYINYIPPFPFPFISILKHDLQLYEEASFHLLNVEQCLKHQKYNPGYGLISTSPLINKILQFLKSSEQLLRDELVIANQMLTSQNIDPSTYKDECSVQDQDQWVNFCRKYCTYTLWKYYHLKPEIIAYIFIAFEMERREWYCKCRMWDYQTIRNHIKKFLSDQK